MQQTNEPRKAVEVPGFLVADFAMEYTGRNLPSLGLMSGDIVCIRATSRVADRNLVVIREQEDNLLCRLFEIKGGLAFVPQDPACPAHIYMGQDKPQIVGAVTGWVHKVYEEEGTGQ